MEVLKLVQECYQANIWFERVANGTVWHGSGNWMLFEIMKLENITNYQVVRSVR